MTAPPLPDVYQAAYLAGGPDRAVDTAVVALLETGRVRAQHSGELSLIQNTPHHPVEAAVLAAIGSGGLRSIDSVRLRAGRDERLTALAERLRGDGLVVGGRLARLLVRSDRPVVLTRAGRRVLRALRSDPPAYGVVGGTSAARVALGGSEQMPDPVLRGAVFDQFAPARDARRAATGLRGRVRYAGDGALGAYGVYSGGGCGAAGGHGGGHGCGGGCGGGGCGGA